MPTVVVLASNHKSKKKELTSDPGLPVHQAPPDVLFFERLSRCTELHVILKPTDDENTWHY